jgi:CBS domain-containing protein
MQRDAMLRHLGAAYYDSLSGRAAPGEVREALAKVASELGDESAAHGPEQHEHHGRLHCRVRDVMAAKVITADRSMQFKDIARLLVEHRISGAPVVLRSGRVVTEDDLLQARDKHASSRRAWTGTRRYGTDRDRYLRLSAEQLMTSPAVTIYPDATIAAAAEVMSLHRVRRLPVVDSDGTLLGVVNRRDLLNVYLVPDEEIARQVRELLAEILPEDGAPVAAEVRGGIVTLTGQPDGAVPHGQLAESLDLAWDIDGVVDIIDHTAGGD